MYIGKIISAKLLYTNENCTADNIGIPVITKGEILEVVETFRARSAAGVDGIPAFIF